jgi:hypothetical protein
MAFVISNFGKFRNTQYALVNRLPSKSDEKSSTYWKTFFHAIMKITALPEATFPKFPTSHTHTLRGDLPRQVSAKIVHKYRQNGQKFI